MRVRLVTHGALLCALASVLLVSPAEGSAQAHRTVTITLYGSGKAFWKLNGSRETGRVSLRYRWHGALTFHVAPSALRDLKHRTLTASSATTLIASWTGTYKNKKGDALTTCRYSGAKVKSLVTATLNRGRADNTIELRFHPRGDRRGFFTDRGRGAVVRCSAGYTQSAPSHFAPSWFFRDNLQDHGRLSSDNAVIVLPSTLLPRRSATVAFPNEKGRNDSVALGHLAWSNLAETAVRAR
jgi:hypothetical protein